MYKSYSVKIYLPNLFEKFYEDSCSREKKFFTLG